MRIAERGENGGKIVVIGADAGEVVIKDVQSALDLLIAAKYEHQADRIAIDKGAVADAFFTSARGWRAKFCKSLSTTGRSWPFLEIFRGIRVSRSGISCGKAIRGKMSFSRPTKRRRCEDSARYKKRALQNFNFAMPSFLRSPAWRQCRRSIRRWQCVPAAWCPGRAR